MVRAWMAACLFYFIFEKKNLPSIFFLHSATSLPNVFGSSSSAPALGKAPGSGSEHHLQRQYKPGLVLVGCSLCWPAEIQLFVVGRCMAGHCLLF